MLTEMMRYKNEAVIPTYMGFVLDVTPISNEIAATTNVVIEYRDIIRNGQLESQEELDATVDAHASIPIDETTVTKEEAQYMGWGRVNGILPYLIQDGYNRKKKPCLESRCA